MIEIRRGKRKTALFTFHDVMMLTKDGQNILRVCYDLGQTTKQTTDYMRDRGFKITTRTVRNYRKRFKFEKKPKVYSKKANCSSKQYQKLSRIDVSNIIYDLTRTDPPTYQSLGLKYGVCTSTISRLKKKFHLKTVKKPRGHAMTPRIVELRKTRALALKKKLKNFGIERVVTSDEAWFYIPGSQGKQEIQHLPKNKKRADADVTVKRSHPKGLMVWSLMCHRGIVGPFFVDAGAKINSDYYIKSILEPALDKVPELYPDGEFMWHHDSAPAHVSKKTIEYLTNRCINFVKKEEWLPCSPDVSPCDYFLWGFTKHRVLKRTDVKTLDDLKAAIIDEFAKVPQDMIVRSMNSFLLRLQEVYNVNGMHVKTRL